MWPAAQGSGRALGSEEPAAWRDKGHLDIGGTSGLSCPAPPEMTCRAAGEWGAQDGRTRSSFCKPVVPPSRVSPPSGSSAQIPTVFSAHRQQGGHS